MQQGVETTNDVTDLIWKGAGIRSFLLFNEPPSVWAEAWTTVTALLASGAVKPIVAKIFPFEAATDALRYLIEERPLGRVIVSL
ncbi:MAG: zinc-binding dehydrogenase [Paraburkholderia sp.]|uniref:zinc-binding dehydrogenase n=1 Tax=Paraburkholderia sp. TaxID=1926495 RepID=UPI003C5CC964